MDWENEKKLLVILVLFFLVTRFALINYLPLIQDENIYSIMIEEQIDNPTLVPTFLGYEVGWKPPIFFWVYGLFAMVLSQLPVSIEVVYRLPTLIFGLINLILVFKITKEITKKNEIAFFTAFIYEFIFLVIYTDLIVMTDILAVTFILASILTYLYAQDNHKLFLLAGLFSFLAFFTKQVNALVAPIFIFAYFFQTNKKILSNPMFIISLIAVPLAFLTNYIMFSSSEQAYAVYSDLIEKKIISSLNLQSFYGSIGPFYLLVSIWIPLSLFGFIKHWRKNLAMSIWYALTIFPLVAGFYMPFYYLPIIPPLAFFSALILLYNEKNELTVDKFFYFILGLMLIIGLIVGSYFYVEMKNAYSDQKDAGMFIASKKNVMIVGEYNPGIFGYKMLLDKRKNGEWPEVGWIITSGEEKNLKPFLSDYHYEGSSVVDGNFAKMYFEANTYRKDTNLTNFDYVVIVSDENVSFEGFLVLNQSNIKIFKR
jgi:hypothetical protein